MRVINNKKSFINPNHHLFLLFKAVVIALFFLSGTALAVDTQCKPDNIMVSGFENEMPLLFEDTFEGCRSPLWRELNGNWQVTDGAYHTSEFSNSNWLPLEPNNFTVELEMSDIQGGGLWMRLADGSGVILQIGSTSGDDFLFWQVLEADVPGPSINPSANGVITPGTGKHIIKVVVEGAIYEAYVDGKLATTLSHADVIGAGATPPTRGVVGLQGHDTSTRFDRIRIWGKNSSTLQIAFTTDQSVLLESIGQSYQFGAHVVNSLGEDVPGIDLEWSLEPGVLVSMTASDASSATVQADALGVDAVTLKASVPSLQISNDAQILLADLVVGANYLDSDVIVDNGYLSGQVVLVRNAETELIQVGDVLISGDGAGLLVRVLTVTLTADQVILTVEAAKITDAFQNLEIDTASAMQSLTVHFDAVTNLVKVKSSTKYGVVRIQSFTIDGLKCKAEDQSDFGLNLTGGSIDWEIDNQLNATLRITNSTVQEFSFSATQSLVLTATTGSLEFSSVLAGAVTCELPLPRFETPTLPVSVFSFGLGIQPKVGVKVSGSISGPSFTIEGPKSKLTDSATEGIKYTSGGGWEPIGLIDRNVETDPINAMFDTSIEIDFDASAYGGVGFEIIANLGRGILSYELAAVEFADVNSDVTLHSEISSPFDPMAKNYSGPKWDLEGNIKGVFKAELTSGGLTDLLKQLDVPTTLPFTSDIFNPVVSDIAHSPRSIFGLVRCSPLDCFFDPALNGGQATFNISTDANENGSISYLASINDGADPLVSITSGSLSRGNAAGIWSPTLSDQEGRYKTYLRVETDDLSKTLPYVLDSSDLREIVVGPISPQISVTLMGASVSSSSETVAYDFGDIEVYEEQDVELTISNIGLTPLAITGVSLGSGFSGILDPGETVAVTGTYTPRVLGPSTFTVVISSNDSDESYFNLVLKSNVVKPPPPTVTLSAPNCYGTARIFMEYMIESRADGGFFSKFTWENGGIGGNYNGPWGRHHAEVYGGDIVACWQLDAYMPYAGELTFTATDEFGQVTEEKVSVPACPAVNLEPPEWDLCSFIY